MSAEQTTGNGKGKEVNFDGDDDTSPDPKERNEAKRQAKEAQLDPDDYLHARKKLKQAVLEHYR